MFEFGDRGGEVVFELEGEADVVVEVGAGGVEVQAGAELFQGEFEVGLLEVGDAVVFAQG